MGTLGAEGPQALTARAGQASVTFPDAALPEEAPSALAITSRQLPASPATFENTRSIVTGRAEPRRREEGRTPYQVFKAGLPDARKAVNARKENAKRKAAWTRLRRGPSVK